MHFRSSKPSLRSHKSRRRRSGAVVVEFAITLPVMFLFFFAAIEFCRVAMIRHTVDHAAYEAARVGAVPGATNAKVEAKAREVLGQIGLRNVTLSTQPNPLTPKSTTLTVSIGVPLDTNLFSPARFFGGKRFERTFTMQRELAVRL